MVKKNSSLHGSRGASIPGANTNPKVQLRIAGAAMTTNRKIILTATVLTGLLIASALGFATHRIEALISANPRWTPQQREQVVLSISGGAGKICGAATGLVWLLALIYRVKGKGLGRPKEATNPSAQA
jgi:hypothetical protein